MDIGKPQRIIRVVPRENPVPVEPRRVTEPARPGRFTRPAPRTPVEDPSKAPTKVPAK